jgi:hypothetical protein
MTRALRTAVAVTALTVALGAFARPGSAQTLLSGKVSAFSTSVLVDKGQAVGNGSLVLPPCPSGELFLVQHLTAAPDPRTLLGTSTLPGPWSVIPSTTQHRASGGMAILPLTAYGHGPDHAEVSLPGGQPIYSSTIYYTVMLVGAAAPTPIRFNLHFSGACGKQTLAP